MWPDDMVGALDQQLSQVPSSPLSLSLSLSLYDQTRWPRRWPLQDRLRRRLQQEFCSSAFHCFHCSRNVTMPGQEDDRWSHLYLLLNEFATPSQSCLEAKGQEGICVEEREPGVAVVVVAIDLDWGTILTHSAAFTYVAQNKNPYWK
jgi:hypothetical protein